MDEDDYTCDHNEVEEGMCLGCGLMLEEDTIDFSDKIQHDDAYHLGRPMKKEAFSYYDQLAKLELEPEICNHVCQQIGRLKEKSHVRIATHMKHLFVMIYIAYNTNKIKFNPNEIGKKLGMTTKAIRDAVKIASVGIDDEGDRNPVCIFSPFNFIREIAALNEDKHIIPEENYTLLEELIDLFMSHNRMLENENPKGIAVTVLKIYYDWNKIPTADFIKKTGRTPGYIKSKESAIIQTLNEIQIDKI